VVGFQFFRTGYSIHYCKPFYETMLILCCKPFYETVLILYGKPFYETMLILCCFNSFKCFFETYYYLIMKRIPLFFALFLSLAALRAQAVLGTWKTIDDETKEARSHLELYLSNGKLYGKVVNLLKSEPTVRCEKCPGERKDQPLMGMLLLVDMIEKEGYWQSGNILDPEKGKWYTCKLWLKDGDPNVLAVRGYLGPFYRTQYWHRVP